MGRKYESGHEVRRVLNCMLALTKKYLPHKRHGMPKQIITKFPGQLTLASLHHWLIQSWCNAHMNAVATVAEMEAAYQPSCTISCDKANGANASSRHIAEALI